MSGGYVRSNFQLTTEAKNGGFSIPKIRESGAESVSGANGKVSQLNLDPSLSVDDDERFEGVQSEIMKRAHVIRQERGGRYISESDNERAYSEKAAELGVSVEYLRHRIGKVAAASRNDNGSPLVSAGVDPLISIEVVPSDAEIRREEIRKSLVSGLKRVGLKKGQKARLKWVDRETAKTARELLKSVVPSLRWKGYRSEVEGIVLVVERQ